MRAGHDFECATAHPRLEGQLQILTAPDIEAGIVGAQTLEELTVDGEQPACHCGRINRLRCALKNIQKEKKNKQIECQLENRQKSNRMDKYSQIDPADIFDYSGDFCYWFPSQMKWNLIRTFNFPN